MAGNRARKDTGGKRKRRRDRSSSSSSSTSSSSSGGTPPPRCKKARKSADSQVPSCNNMVLNSMVPEFDPLTDKVDNWLNIVDLHAKTFSWKDAVIIFQAVNKLKGTSKTWYDSFIKNDCSWAAWTWKNWRDKISFTFQTRRNMHSLLKEIIDSKPSDSQSLYEFYFEQKCKIDKLHINFTERDIISIIIGNINDPNITASVDAGNFLTCDQLAAFLHGRIYTMTSHLAQPAQIPNHSQYSHQKHAPKIQPKVEPGSTVANESANRSNEQSTSLPSTSFKPGRQLRCFGCGGNHKRFDCTEVCTFCSKKGHSESYCRSKKQSEVKPEVKLINTESKKKFTKMAKLGTFPQQVFIDMGSDCSLITAEVAKKLKFMKSELTKPINLQGFSKNSVATVTEFITTTLVLDDVEFENVKLYVINNLSGCEVLIGRNVTEDPSVMYVRIGDVLKFEKTEKINLVLSSDELDFNVSLKYKGELKQLFDKYPKSYSTNLATLGKARDYEIEIELESKKPVCFRPYRLPDCDRVLLRKIIDELLEYKIIQESRSAYASPVLLVDKKEGEKRLCIDYRSLNKITIKDKYPMPRIEDLLDRLKGCKYFTSLDLKSGYYQIGVKNESIDKTAFITEDGHYEFLRMPFGLSNGPSVFQRLMNRILGNLRFGSVIVYLDDLLIISETVEQNLSVLESVLNLIVELLMAMELNPQQIK